MSAAALPLQDAISTAVTTAVTPIAVYDVVPTTPTYPFVIVGDDASKDWSTSEAYGEDVTVTVHVWSQDTDRAELKTIQQQIYDALHDQNLAVSGFNVAALLFVSAESVFDEDKDALHGTSKFRCLLSA
jgi:hypothetical protein